MKRRRFFKTVALAPAVPALVAQQGAAPQAPAPAGRGGGRGGRGGQAVAPVELTAGDTVAEPVTRFFTSAQFATLHKLSGIFEPPMNGAIGALDTDAPEFLDFLIGASPVDRQLLYRNGLDALNAQARTRFGKAFADLDATQADAILKPLLVPVAWAYDPPKDPLKHFVFAAREDIRTATRNSREAATASAPSGRRGGAGAGLYWNPIDPV
jgi:hypothetical protein